MLKKILVGLLLVLTIKALAQQVLDLNVPQVKYPMHKINAYWIHCPTQNYNGYSVQLFRKSFEINQLPDSFIIHISADNHFQLYINGHFVCHGPSRSDTRHWRYHTLNIASFLQSGQNVIAVQVNNWGFNRGKLQLSAATGLFIQGHTELEKTINTEDKTWLCIENSAYKEKPVQWMYKEDVADGFYAIHPTDSIEGRLYPWNWQTLNFNDSKWIHPQYLANAGLHGTNYWGLWQLLPATTHPVSLTTEKVQHIVRSAGLENLKNNKFEKPIIIPSNTSASFIIDQNRLTTGYMQLNVSGGKNSKVQLMYSEAMYNAHREKGNRNDIKDKRIIGIKDIILPEGGENRTYSPLYIRPFRFLQVDVVTKDSALTINSINNIFTTAPELYAASFHCSDTSMQAIWNMCERTLKISNQDLFMSDASYEQMQYIGDSRVHSLSYMYATGNDILTREALQQFNYSRTPEGLTLACYPNEFYLVIPTYSLVFIYMLNDYMMTRGDSAFLMQFVPAMRDILNWYQTRVDQTGMLGKLEWWNYVDWASGYKNGEPTDASEGHSSVLTLHYAYALQKAAAIFSYLNLSHEAEKHKQQAEDITSAVYNQCFDSEKGLIAETPLKNKFSQHANIFAVLTNTFSQAEYQNILKKTLTDKSLIQCTFYFRSYLFEAMSKAGMNNRFIDELHPWQQMIAQGLTTTPEEPEKPRSDCHSWSTIPVYGLLAYTCGIQPLEPGFKKVRVAPALGNQQFIKGKLPTALGNIIVDLQKKGSDNIEGTVELPIGMTGTFIYNGKEIPLSSGKQKVK